MYDAIVHPTDGSSCARRALEHAVSLAKRYDAELHVQYVVRDARVPPTNQAPPVVERLTDVGEDVLETAEERARDADLYQVTTHLQRGRPPTRIRDLVDDQDADLVVMGTHGRSGLERHLLGSTTETLLRQGSVPVLAVEPLDAGE